ncbi:MAG: alpha/beta fold hydrolase [Pseudomonadota bacterium]
MNSHAPFRFESFFVGGCRTLVSGRPSKPVSFTASAPPYTNNQNGHYHLNPAYVQAFLVGQAENLVLVHGGGFTGSMWESTPDARPGWLQHSVAAGFNTYVIDNVGRGRAGWSATDLDALGPPITRTEEEAWELFRLGENSGYADRVAFENQRFPTADLDNLTVHFVPRWLDHKSESAAALLALLERIGPSIVVAHSQGTECVFEAVERNADQFKALVLVEPSAVPKSCKAMIEPQIPVLLVAGDYLDCLPLWRVLAASYVDLVREIESGGGIAKRLDLNLEVGPGFSHLPMMDIGSDKVFQLIHNWLETAATCSRWRA